jgi:hypothetical protein
MQRRRALALLGAIVLMTQVTGCDTDGVVVTDHRTPLRFSELNDLPADPPRLSFGGREITPTMVEWRTDDVVQHFVEGDPTRVPVLTSPHGSTKAELTRSAIPSRLEIGVYPGSLTEIDPAEPPPKTFDCDDLGCLTRLDSGTLVLDLDRIWPEGSRSAVFTITATYFAEQKSVPYGNSIAWVFEVDL